MSGCQSKGGKATGARRKTVSTGESGGRGEETVFPARDIRCEGYQGSGRRLERSGSQRPRKSYTCGTCHDLCCGLARELVTAAFGLGRITMSRKVSEVVAFI